jgi:hypothetical protein
MLFVDCGFGEAVSGAHTYDDRTPILIPRKHHAPSKAASAILKSRPGMCKEEEVLEL